MTPNIWQIQQTLSRRLLLWSGLSVVLGLVLLPFSAFWQAFGIQSIAWGVIDGAIALGGHWFTRRRYARLANPMAAEHLQKESRNLRRILWVNIVLDLFYVLGGVTLIKTRGDHNPGWRGHGWGIILQGSFLFFFDLLHVTFKR